jgi:hypothetical protein
MTEPQRLIQVDVSRLEDIADDARRVVYKLQVSDVYDLDDVLEDAYQLVYRLQRVISGS